MPPLLDPLVGLLIHRQTGGTHYTQGMKSLACPVNLSETSTWCSRSPKLRTPDYSRLSLSRAYRSKVALLPPIGSLGVYKDMGFLRPNPTAPWVYVVGRLRLVYHGLD